MPRQGSEIGIAAVGASFVLSCVAAVQWIQRVEDATGKSLGMLGAFGRASCERRGAPGRRRQPVIHTVTWWQNGSVKFGVGTQIDGLP